MEKQGFPNDGYRTRGALAIASLYVSERRIGHSENEECGRLEMFMKRNANWARIVVAIFTMAVFYASICATTCSIGFCPDQVQQTTGHDCERGDTHHSAPAGHEPASDCSPHQHPGPFLAKSAELPQFRLVLASHLDISAITVSEPHALVLNVDDAAASALGPPVKSSSSLYQSISILRI